MQRVRNQMNRKAILLNSFLDYCNLSKAWRKICSFLLNEHENIGALYVINVIWVIPYGNFCLVSKAMWRPSSCRKCDKKMNILYYLLSFDYNRLCLRMNRTSIFTECTKIYLEVTVKNSGMLIGKWEGISLWIALHLGSILILHIVHSSIQGSSSYTYLL